MLLTPVFLGFPGGSDDKESACNVGDLGLIPGLGRGRHGNPLQYSCLKNPHPHAPLYHGSYSPWGCKESDTTEWLSTACVCVCVCIYVCESCSVVSHSLQPHGLQARILEWVAFPFSRGSFHPRNRTQVSLIAGRFFTSWATREAHYSKG